MSQEPKWHDRHIEAVIAERDRLREENASQARELALLRLVAEKAKRIFEIEKQTSFSEYWSVRDELRGAVEALLASGWQPPREGEERTPK